jgi:hypothetical protein
MTKIAKVTRELTVEREFVPSLRERLADMSLFELRELGDALQKEAAGRVEGHIDDDLATYNGAPRWQIEAEFWKHVATGKNWISALRRLQEIAAEKSN